jgi:hypothetical protein
MAMQNKPKCIERDENQSKTDEPGKPKTPIKEKKKTALASDRISGERSATTTDAEDFGQRPLTSNTVTLYLPGHYFCRSMATHKNNDQFSQPSEW